MLFQQANARQLMHKDFVRLGRENTVGQFIGRLKSSRRAWAVVVNDDNTYYGIASKKHLLKSKLNPGKTKLESISQTLPTLSETDSIQRIAELLFTSDSRMLAVTKKERVVGTVSVAEVIGKMAEIRAFKALKAKEIASSTLLCLPRNATIGKAISVMKENNIGRIPVVDENGLLAGMVSFKEVMENYLAFPPEKQRGFKASPKFSAQKGRLLDLPIENLLGEAATIESNKSITEAAKLMRAKGVLELVLEENSRPVGIITSRDLLEAFLHLREERRSIQFIGLPELDEIDSSKVQETANKAFDKLQKILGRLSYIAIHVKALHATGGRKQYFVHARASVPTMMLVATSSNWNLITAVQESLKDLEKEASKKFRKR